MRGLVARRLLRPEPVALVSTRWLTVLHRPHLLLSGLGVGSHSLGGALKVAVNEGRHIVLVLTAGTSGLTALSDQVLQESILLGSDLLENVRKHILDLLGLGLTHHGEEVLANRELHYTGRNGVSATGNSSVVCFLTCRSAEMDHCVVVFEHVHFFNVIKRLHACFHQHTNVR